jgi:cell division protein FtsA
MNEKSLLIAIDIGTTKVCTIIGVKTTHGTEILGVGSHPSYGLKKGSVINIDKTVKSILSSVEEAKLMAGVTNLSRATIGIAGSHIYSFNSSGVVSVKGKEVKKDDVERVIDAAKAIVIPSDREILHVLPQEYRVDNIGGVKDPIGMAGVRLEAHVHIVTAQTSLMHNLIRCVEQAGITADQVVLQPIASSHSVLTTEEKELGVALVDIGGGTTDIAVWKDGALIHSQIIPIGGNHFTNDLAVALKIPHNEAERIKINHGSVIAEKINNSSHITVQGLAGMKPREIPLNYVAGVLGSRADELFSLVRDIIVERNLGDQVTGGFVLTGGGALITDICELAEFSLERPVKLGYPQPFGGMTNVMQNPKFSTVLGLILEAEKEAIASDDLGTNTNTKNDNDNSNDILKKFSNSLRSVFKDIF